MTITTIISHFLAATLPLIIVGLLIVRSCRRADAKIAHLIGKPGTKPPVRDLRALEQQADRRRAQCNRAIAAQVLTPARPIPPMPENTTRLHISRA